MNGSYDESGSTMFLDQSLARAAYDTGLPLKYNRFRFMLPRIHSRLSAPVSIITFTLEHCCQVHCYHTGVECVNKTSEVALWVCGRFLTVKLRVP
jgi:hypothetical protein